jgi:hypothetical protein
MNALEFNNKIANLITKFITNIPTIGQFDPSRSQRPNRDFIPIIELVNLNYQLNPNDHSSQLNITLRNTMDSKEEEFNEPLQNKVNQFVQNFIDNLTELAGLHLITISTGTPLKIYQHLVMGDTLTYHESDFNYYITYSQYLD